MPALDDRPALDAVAARTLASYEASARAFWEGTRDHDVAQNVDALLDALDGPPPFRILDFGCGPGRDLATFRARGHAPVGLDGCAAFVAMARAHAGCAVLHQSFFALDLPPGAFDGVFANASLFHVPRGVLPRVLGALVRTLVPGGVLFCSNPRSFNVDTEGWRGDRYGAFLTIASWRDVIAAAGLVLEREFLRPAAQPPAARPWLAMVWRKPCA